jgi:murein DD-endopeptidase MepM/ murein hydrolase activator NlpD
MKQPYFIVVLAHSLHGRLRRIHVPHQVLYVILALAVLGLFSAVGFVSSYLRMTWKVANYNALRDEAKSLRSRYQDLREAYDQTNQQMASLQLFASEVITAYGLKNKLEGPGDIANEGRLALTYTETLEEYNFLKSASFSTFQRSYTQAWRNSMKPSMWPVDGRLIGSFGDRSDPFSGGQAFHGGVDISGNLGTPVRATADGVISVAEYASGYGRTVSIDHGRGIQTLYAHLSRIDVIAGQEIRRGEIVGAVGRSGRATGPHLHYEVRVGGNPINPYTFLARAAYAQRAVKDLPF